MEGSRERRRAQNEIAARNVNESIDEERADEGAPGPRWFVCECAHADCAELIDVGADKYHEVRADPRRFIVMPTHEDPQIETVVETHTTYVVVEKQDAAGELAEEDADD